MLCKLWITNVALCVSIEKNIHLKKEEGKERECVEIRMGRVTIYFLHTEEVSVNKLQFSHKQDVQVTMHRATSVYVQ